MLEWVSQRAKSISWLAQTQRLALVIRNATSHECHVGVFSEPNLFSFNSPYGACPEECQEYIEIEPEFDETKFIRNFHLKCQNYLPIDFEENSDITKKNEWN